ncbi:MAG: ABC transporter substrate-binding protein [Candidatus Bathyarchaeia archaeon]
MKTTSAITASQAIILVIILAVAIVGGYMYYQTTIPAAPLIIGTTDKITVLDPAKSYDFYTWEVFNNIGEGLLRYKSGTTEIQPGLAESYTVSPDGREYTFKLRKGLKFTDGQPLNAEVVKWSIDRVMDLDLDPAWLVTEFVDHVEVVDEYTVKFVLQAPAGFFPALVAMNPPYFPISPKSWPADRAEDSTTGIGPYRVVEWTRDVELVLEANPDYWGPAPKTKNLVIRFFKDAATMRLAVEKGEIDVAWRTIGPADIQDIKKKGELSVIEAPGPYIRYLIVRCDRPPFDDVRLRQAVAAAVDRSAITETVFLGTATPLYSMVPIGMWSHIDGFKDKYGERNLDLSRSLLRDAGYSETNPFEFELWWTPTHYGDTEKDVASVLKESLEETGMMKVNLKSAEWATFAAEYIIQGTMPIFLLGWYPDYLDPDNYVASFIATDPEDYGLGTFYYNPSLLAKVRQARSETDMAKRTDLYKEIQVTFAEEVAQIPLFQGKLTAVTRPGVKGVVINPYLLLDYFLIYK